MGKNAIKYLSTAPLCMSSSFLDRRCEKIYDEINNNANRILFTFRSLSFGVPFCMRAICFRIK